MTQASSAPPTPKAPAPQPTQENAHKFEPVSTPTTASAQASLSPQRKTAETPKGPKTDPKASFSETRPAEAPAEDSAQSAKQSMMEEHVLTPKLDAAQKPPDKTEAGNPILTAASEGNSKYQTTAPSAEKQPLSQPSSRSVASEKESTEVKQNTSPGPGQTPSMMDPQRMNGHNDPLSEVLVAKTTKTSTEKDAAAAATQPFPVRLVEGSTSKQSNDSKQMTVEAFVVNLPEDQDRYIKFRQWWDGAWPELHINRVEGIRRSVQGQGILESFISALKSAQASNVDVAMFFEDDAKPFETEMPMKQEVERLVSNWPENSSVILLGGNHFSALE